jgi:hypothetical protein
MASRAADWFSALSLEGVVTVNEGEGFVLVRVSPFTFPGPELAEELEDWEAPLLLCLVCEDVFSPLCVDDEALSSGA